MARKVCAQNVFGQVLICLRMSQLDYVVKETPYAAYVTVRKQFMKHANVEKDVIEVEVGKTSVEKENTKLKEKKDIPTY